MVHSTRNSNPDDIKQRPDSHHPANINQAILAVVNDDGCDLGSECKALSAATVTDLDFLYKAGFHIGNPNGCSMLMA